MMPSVGPFTLFTLQTTSAAQKIPTSYYQIYISSASWSTSSTSNYILQSHASLSAGRHALLWELGFQDFASCGDQESWMGWMGWMGWMKYPTVLLHFREIEFSEWYFEYKSLLDNKRLNLDLMALWTCLMISCVVSHPKPETVCSNSPGSFHSLESSSVQSHRAMEIHSMCDINIPDIPEILHITMKLQTCHETAGASTLPKVCKRRIIKVIQSHPILSKHHGLGRWRLRFPCLWSFGLSTYTFFKSLSPALGCGGCPWNSPAKSQSPGPPPLQGATWKTGEFGTSLAFLDCAVLPRIWPSKCRNMSLSCHHFEPCQSFLLKKSKMQVEEDLVAQAMERAPRTISASFTWQNAQNTTFTQHLTISIEKLWVLSINAKQKRHFSTFGSSFGSFNTGLMLNSKSHTSANEIR